MNFIIEEGNVQEIEIIIKLIKDIHSRIENKEWYSIDLPFYDKIYERINNGGKIIKVLSDNKIIAFLIIERYINRNSEIAKEIKDEELEKSIELDNAGVLEDYRGNHLEQKMILFGEELYKKEDKNIKYSYTTVHPDNLASLKSLENIGYKKYKEKLMYGGKLRYIMRKEL